MAMGSPASRGSRSEDALLREAEDALRGLGYPRARSGSRRVPKEPSFWVENPRNRRRTIPVYVEPIRPGTEASAAGAWTSGVGPSEEARLPSILVVPTDEAAEVVRDRLRRPNEPSPPDAPRILVLRDPRGRARSPHWHRLQVEPREVLRLSTGIVVGMYQRAFAEEGNGEVDFGELLAVLRDEYGLDVPGSLGVASDEDALFILYHLALRDSFAPGSIAANLHSIVANPTGPASRIPWFAG
jgi:hypothetical protein